MQFPKSQLLNDAVKSYYNTNIKNLIVYKKTRIYFPKDCSEQMAKEVYSYMIERNSGIEFSDIKKNSKGSFQFDVVY